MAKDYHFNCDCGCGGFYVTRDKKPKSAVCPDCGERKKGPAWCWSEPPNPPTPDSE